MYEVLDSIFARESFLKLKQSKLKMHSVPLKLSYKGSATFVPAQIVRNLKKHHLVNIRKLFTYLNQFNAAILNCDYDMDYYIQVLAVCVALRSQMNSVLILCPDDKASRWQKYFRTLSDFYTFIVRGDTPDTCGVQIVTFSVLKRMKRLETEWSLIIVEEIEAVVNKRAISNLGATFRLGITARNFIEQPDYKLMWNISKWINFKTIPSEVMFAEMFKSSLKELRYPFEPPWIWLTWSYFDLETRPDNCTPLYVNLDEPSEFSTEEVKTESCANIANISPISWGQNSTEDFDLTISIESQENCSEPMETEEKMSSGKNEEETKTSQIDEEAMEEANCDTSIMGRYLNELEKAELKPSQEGEGKSETLEEFFKSLIS